MITTRMLKSGFKTAWSHKLRATFMIASVMIGIASLTVIISLGKGTQEEVLSRVKKFFSATTINVMSGRVRMQGTHAKMDPTTTLKLSDIEDIAARIKTIVSWDAGQVELDKSASFNGQNAIVSLHGHMPSAEAVWNLVITEGRFFTKAENDGTARVAVIAPDVRKELFGDSGPIGRQIGIEGVPFQVIGTIAPRGPDPHGMSQDDQIIIPLNTMLKRTVNLDYVIAAKFIVTDKHAVNSAAEQITQILRERHRINTDEGDDFTVITPQAVNDMIRRATRVFNLYLPMLSVVFLIIGALIVANLMLLSVSERMKEIGLRKAVGAKSKDIQLQFLIEASSITLFAGSVGFAAGALLLLPITKMIDVPYTISWSVMLFCLAASSFIGIAAGFIPARRAAVLQPVESLR
ncbi:MAG: ABC transporter permease [Bacteroidota bacterium]|nr:ABC transporter permease [Bacteroidota bacterium]